jgi:hypothetical protein
MKRNRILFPMLVLTLSVLSAYVCGATYIVALQLSLSPTDLAYGQTLSATFSDPFVLWIGAEVATVVGLVAFPIALFCLWHRDLLRCSLFVVGLTLLYIVFATTIASPRSTLGCPLVAFAALLFCRVTRLPFFQLREESTNVV